ncbi:MAG TPA: hypothetical protein VG652_01840 [Gaiellaceae bacterium]|nr:hypothetical protein [Gaiellaceae bacterium]
MGPRRAGAASDVACEQAIDPTRRVRERSGLHVDSNTERIRRAGRRDESPELARRGGAGVPVHDQHAFTALQGKQERFGSVRERRCRRAVPKPPRPGAQSMCPPKEHQQQTQPRRVFHPAKQVGAQTLHPHVAIALRQHLVARDHEEGLELRFEEKPVELAGKLVARAEHGDKPARNNLDAKLEPDPKPPLMLVHEIDLETVLAGFSRRDDRNRHDLLLAWRKIGRKRCPQRGCVRSRTSMPAICQPDLRHGLLPAAPGAVAFIRHEHIDRLIDVSDQPADVLAKLDATAVEILGPGATWPETVDLRIRGVLRSRPRLWRSDRLRRGERAGDQHPVGVGYLERARLLSELWEVERRIQRQPGDTHAAP